MEEGGLEEERQGPKAEGKEKMPQGHSPWKYDFLRADLAPAVTDRVDRRLNIERRSLMAKPSVLALGELACADKYLVSIVTVPVSDG